MTDPTRLAAALAERYRIERELGQGGMATVYLAHDVKHDRKVALKVLRPELSAILGGERFLQEIKTTANLQHPHILGLFDSGEADGSVFYVMPYVEGENLRDRLERDRQLPVEEAVRIAREVADALEYAHLRGIVHRDIKPENILLHGGHAMVADFGIALAVSRGEGAARLTETGMSVGTPHYMAPEQAMGERGITPRADIYALGCVVYEMLSGEPPFTGPTAQAIVARVLTEDPRDLLQQRRSIPSHVAAAVERALEKLPADRFASAGEFAAALGATDVGLPSHHRSDASRRDSAPAGRGLRRNRPAQALAAALLVTLMAAGWGWTRNPGGVRAPVVRVVLAPVPGIDLPTTMFGTAIAISRDGSKIAFRGTDAAGRTPLYVRFLDREQPVAVVDSGGVPFFSPDGLSLGFYQAGRLRSIAIAGGPVVDLCAAGGARGATWGDDGSIIFGSPAGLMRCAAGSSQPELLLPSPANGGYVYPTFLPGSRAVLFGITGDSAGGAVLTVASRAVTRLGVPAINLQYADPGLLLYGQAGGTVSVVAFDARRLRISGRPEMLTDQVLVRADGTARFSVARSGTLAYFVRGDEADRELVLLDRQGRATVIGADRRLYHRPRFSPDGRSVAFGTARSSVAGSDLWVYGTAARAAQRLTTDSSSAVPEWDGDGRRLVFRRSVGATAEWLMLPADGSAPPTAVPGVSARVAELVVVPGQRTVVIRETTVSGASRVVMAPRDSPQVQTELLAATVGVSSIAVSPDGRWLVYVSTETGASEVYIRRLQPGSGKSRVSPNGGAEPRFAGTGELFFRARDSVFVSRVEAGPEPRVGAPQALFGGAFDASNNEAWWDVSPDGTRFVMVRSVAGAVGSRIGLLLNWADQRP